MGIINRFLEEQKKWQEAGSYYRTKEQILEIHKICSSCEHFLKMMYGNGACKVCKCNISTQQIPVNKIALSTTRCPLEEPKWIEEENPSNIQSKIKSCCGDKQNE